MQDKPGVLVFFAFDQDEEDPDDRAREVVDFLEAAIPELPKGLSYSLETLSQDAIETRLLAPGAKHATLSSLDEEVRELAQRTISVLSSLGVGKRTELYRRWKALCSDGSLYDTLEEGIKRRITEAEEELEKRNTVIEETENDLNGVESDLSSATRALENAVKKINRRKA